MQGNNSNASVPDIGNSSSGLLMFFQISRKVNLNLVLIYLSRRNPVVLLISMA
jgi:hypothetical protein